MQGLRLKKNMDINMLRKLQADFKKVIDGIKKGSGVKISDLLGTPGAGKSTIPIQACELIKAGLADAVLWVVPRSALQNQGEHGFIDPFFMDLFNHNFQIRESTNEYNPCRGTSGFVTTYQAIGVDTKNTVLNEVKSKKYIIILDEFHHLEKDGVWHKAIDKIVMAGHFLIKMTGTLGRGDKKEIAYINYKNKKPYFKNCDEEALIVYSRIDALKEKAILPIEFDLSDGEFEWAKRNGEHASVKSFKQAFTPQQKSEALFTAINSEFAADLLRSCVISWQALKKKNSNAKMLVVTADYKLAKDAVFMLSRSSNIQAEIATSHKSKNAIKSIKRFKSGSCKCLVTIAMAYEGLDVPGITHICVLTNIRSREWIEQMLARGVRIDKHPSAGPYELQRCYVFAPMDRQFKKVVDMIRKQQVSAIEFFSKIKEEKEIDPDPEQEPDPDAKKRGEITPISSKLTGNDNFLMGLGDDMSRTDPVMIVPAMTIKERELLTRKTIHTHVNRYCFDNRYRQERINHELKLKFGKARKLMTLPELKILMTYLIKYYPVEKTETIRDIKGVSIRRGKSIRVSNKVKPFFGSSDIIKQSNYDIFNNLMEKKC